MDPALQELAAVAGAEEIEAIIKLRDPGEVPPHVRVVTRFGDIATCRLPGNRIEEVWAHPATVSLKAARLLEYDVELYLDEQSEDVELRVTDARRPAGISVAGRDIVIGVVDWGVDVAHKNLVNPDGSTRFLAVWDQRDGPSDAAPQPYGYGRVLTRDDINAALATEQPYEALGYHPEEGDPLHNGAHGTHVLDIAAGNGAVPASPMGLAPEADLVFVHLSAGRLGGLATLGDSVRILEALDFIRRTAGERPWVINTSLGRHSGGHRGLSLVEQGMDAMLLEAPGRAIVQSCGNYYRAHAHACGRLLPGRSRVLTWRTSRADVTPNELEIWYPVGDRFHLTMRSPIGNGVFKAGLGEITPIVIAGEEVGRIYHRKLDPTGEHHIDIFLRPGAPSGDWQVELSAVHIVDGRFDAYVERDPGCPDCQSRFHPDDFEPRRTLGSICNGFHTIAVGAYDGHDPDRRLGTFSSSGPTRDGRQRPNLVAPGVSVLAARSAARDPEAAPMVTRKTGTSMAAPHVTGTIALMFEAAPRPLRIRETHRLLLSTTDEAEGDADFQLRIGTGYLNIAGAVEAAAEGMKSLPVGEARGIEMEDHTGETRVDASLPVLVEDADEQALTPDTEEEIGSAIEAQDEHEESDVPRAPECACAAARATEVLDEPRVAAQETEAFDEPWGAAGEIESRAPTSEELVDRAAEAVASADIRHVMGPEAVASPALLFDSLACDIVPGLCEHLEASFDVVALPGESLEEPPQAGDIVVVRALAEGDLALAEVIVEECPESAASLHARVVSLDESAGFAEMRRLTDAFGRLDHCTLILRPHSEDIPNSREQVVAGINLCQRRRDIVRIARAEERRWTRPDGTKILESDRRMRPVLESYWRIVPGFRTAAAASAKARESARGTRFGYWSAAFICFVMDSAGVRRADGFNFSQRHMNYIVGALRNRERSDRNRPFWLCDDIEVQHECRPVPGDLLCFNRCVRSGRRNGRRVCLQMTHHSYFSLRRRYWLRGGQARPIRDSSHCSLVVGTVQRRGQRFIQTIGGNERDSVRLRAHIPIDRFGGIPNPQAHDIFGLIKLIGC